MSTSEEKNTHKQTNSKGNKQNWGKKYQPLFYPLWKKKKDNNIVSVVSFLFFFEKIKICTILSVCSDFIRHCFCLRICSAVVLLVLCDEWRFNCDWWRYMYQQHCYYYSLSFLPCLSTVCNYDDIDVYITPVIFIDLLHPILSSVNYPLINRILSWSFLPQCFVNSSLMNASLITPVIKNNLSLILSLEILSRIIFP